MAPPRKLPLDRGLLHRLYVVEELTLLAVGERLGVSQQAVYEALVALGIPRRAAKRPPATTCACGRPVVKRKANGKGYRSGTRCDLCWRQYCAQLTAESTKRHPEAAPRRKFTQVRWKVLGSLTSSRGLVCQRKSRNLVRTLRRLLRSGEVLPPAALRLPARDSATLRSLLTSSRSSSRT